MANNIWWWLGLVCLVAWPFTGALALRRDSSPKARDAAAYSTIGLWIACVVLFAVAWSTA